MIKVTRFTTRRMAQLATLLVGIGVCASGRAADVDFLRDVRPILSSKCFKCHGPDEAKRKGELRFDIRDAAIAPAESGRRAIIPGNASGSEAIKRVFSTDPDEVMPPPAAKMELSEDEKAVLVRWIESGAKYERHWAFVPPFKAEAPAVKDAEWSANSIDRFVLAKLESKGLRPSEAADKYTLVRRVYLDLIGLPPTPEEADAFVNDASPDAYEKLVDRLLASKHYGERWARQWLDLARYADTNGYEKDRPREIWKYRDWVINALNADMPFDQFTVEQIAGDMLPDATLDQIVATGFHRNTMRNEEGGIDPLEYRFHSMVDRVHVTATTWLGLTMSCAQCHTHKYDPIQHEEYFQFMAFMNNADEPTIPVVDQEIAAQRKEIEAKARKMEGELIGLFPPRVEVDWSPLSGQSLDIASDAEASQLDDGSWRVSGERQEKDVYTIRFTTEGALPGFLQLEAIPFEVDGEDKGPGRTDHGNFVVNEVEVRARRADDKEAESVEVKLADASADFSQDGFDVARAIDGKKDTGWAVSGAPDGYAKRSAKFTLELSEMESGPIEWTVTLTQNYGSFHTLGRFRLQAGTERQDPRPMEQRRREHFDEKFAEWISEERGKAVAWQRLHPVSATSNEPILTIEDDHTVFASGDFTKSDTYRVELSGAFEGMTAIRLEALADERLPGGGPGSTDYEGPVGEFFLSTFVVEQDGERAKIVSASDSYSRGPNGAAKAIDEDAQSGWSIRGGVGRDHNAVFVFKKPLSKAGSVDLSMTFERYYASGLGKFRLWGTKAEAPTAVGHPNDIRELLLKSADDLSRTERGELRQYFAKTASELGAEREKIDKLRREMPEHPTTLVMRERPDGHERATHLHNRGEFLQPRQAVEPRMPSFLPALAEGEPRNRLGFARWLVSRDNPLTARVTMNRDWSAFFGEGLVRTLEDFGFQGELPTHPELLDWLAVEFMDRGWSRKAMHKLIVTSATYRQASNVSPELLEADPDNRWFTRGPRFRLDAELIRDSALVASGLLSEKLGGPSVFPPQPENVTTEGAYGQLQWNVSEGEDRNRRGLYTFMKRTAPFAMFIAFDAPSGEACVARRGRSNTPLQSLTLLNDRMFIEFANAMGESVSAASGSDADKVKALFRRCVTRPPEAAELEMLTGFYRAQKERFDSGELKASEYLGTEEADADVAAWAAVARVILNLDETVTKS